MARRSAMRTASTDGEVHPHRTAKVIELIGSSTRGFDHAILNAIQDAGATLHGITGAHVQNMSVRCEDGRITEYKVDLRVAFGIDRTRQP